MTWPGSGGVENNIGPSAMARSPLIESRGAEAEKILRRVLETERNDAVALDLFAVC